LITIETGGGLSGGIINDATGAVAVVTASISGIVSSAFNSAGTGHAIELTATGTYDWDGNTHSGYGADGTTDAVVYNNSGGTITINVNSGDTPTYLNGSGATTVIVAGAVPVKVTAQTDAGAPIETARVHLVVSSGVGPFPYLGSVSIANSTTTATVTHTTHGMASGDKVLIIGASLDANNGVFTITVTGADTYTYTMASSPGSSPTGTITSTFVALSGTTDANGEISVSRVYPTGQPVTGWTRKSSSSPFYKQGVINATISSTAGMDYTAVMVSDE
jgi:hypothetical protein